MEINTMGKVLVEVKIENFEDLFRVRAGDIAAKDVKSVTVQDALVDTGATMLSLPKRLIEQLGLRKHRTRRVRTAGGVVDCGIYDAVRLTVLERDVTVDVAEVPDESPVLIGQIPLGGLDFVVDPIGQRLIGNPEHNGEHMVDMFCAAGSGGCERVLSGVDAGAKQLIAEC